MDTTTIDLLFTFLGLSNLFAFGLVAWIGTTNRKLRRANRDLAQRLLAELQK